MLLLQNLTLRNYYNSNKKLKEAYQHINNVINESNGESVFSVVGLMEDDISVKVSL